MKSNPGRLKLYIGIAFIVAVAITIAVVLTTTSTENRSRATEAENPIDLIVSNVTGSSATITWRTTIATNGRLKYGPDASVSQLAYDTRDAALTGATFESQTHYITVGGLKNNTKYFFKVLSNGKDTDQTSLKSDFTTLPDNSGLSTPKPIYGKIDGVEKGSEAIVVLTAKVGDVESQPIASLTTDTGTYSLDLSNLRTSSGNKILLDANSQLIVRAYGKSSKQAQIVAGFK